jgi:hypothetical protein
MWLCGALLAAVLTPPYQELEPDECGQHDGRGLGDIRHNHDGGGPLHISSPRSETASGVGGDCSIAGRGFDFQHGVGGTGVA